MSDEAAAPAPVIEENLGPQGAIIPEQAETAPEVAPEPEKAETPKDDKFASKFAALSRKEKQVREQEKALNAERQRIKAMETELKRLQERLSGEDTSLKARLKKEPLKVLEENELSFEQLSEMVLNDGNPTPQRMMEQLKAELQREYKTEVEQLREQLKAKEEREEKERYAQAVDGFKAELKQLIDTNDEFELTRANQAYDLVFDVVEEYYNKTGKVLGHDEAARYVEQHLEEEANRILQLKKVQSKLQKPAQPPPKVDAKPTSPTLSNTLSAEAPVNGERKLTREQAIAEAAKLIRWTES